MPYTLMVLDPGHFHAALPLRARHPLLVEDVHVFASDGPGLERFLALVGRFNARAEAPTAWRLHVHRSDDPLAALLAARPGEVAVLAGRNQGKLARISALVRAGIHVLADKPWVVEPTDAGHLASLAAAPAHAADLMTERHEPGAALFADLARTPGVTGGADPSRGPVLVKQTVHHLAKLVDGVPLIRPSWYFDTRIQGEGVVDVTTHMIDQALLIAGAADRPLAPGEVVLDGVRRWDTVVPQADFAAITGLATFPAELAERLADGVLPLTANGELGFRCRGLTCQVRAEWRLRDADGAGDRHRSCFHGLHADLELDGSASAGSRLLVRPHREATVVRAALADWAHRHAGVTMSEADGGTAVVPARWSSHDEHFALVLAGFLAGLSAAQPAWDRAALQARYALLAEALAACRPLARGW